MSNKKIIGKRQIKKQPKCVVFPTSFELAKRKRDNDRLIQSYCRACRKLGLPRGK